MIDTNEKTMRWVKITIDETYQIYELVNSAWLNDSNVMHEFCKNMAFFNRIPMLLSNTWEIVDYPPEEILMNKIKERKQHIELAQSELAMLHESLEQMISDGEMIQRR